MDDNRFLGFASGIAVDATGHSHPQVGAAIKAQEEGLAIFEYVLTLAEEESL